MAAASCPGQGVDMTRMDSLEYHSFVQGDVSKKAPEKGAPKSCPPEIATIVENYDGTWSIHVHIFDIIRPLDTADKIHFTCISDA